MPKEKEQPLATEVDQWTVSPTVPEDMKPAPKFPIEDYYRTIEDEEEILVGGAIEVRITKKEVLRDPFKTKSLLKCKIRAARFFDVTIRHLEDAYKVLNGKKIDGITFNMLIDRFGFTGNELYNRATGAAKAGVTLHAYEIATEKLKNILSYNDVYASYMRYVRTFEREKSVDAVIGELNM